MSDAKKNDNTGLKAWLRDLCHGRGPVAAALRVEHDEQPYEPAARRWKQTPDELRPEFIRIVRELVEEAATGPWTPDAFHQLAFFVEAAELLDVRPAFEKAADRLRRSRSEYRDQLLMIALRTLLALGGRATPEFWLEQEKFIGATWPELIFMGLARHDLDHALAQVPRLITTAQQMQSLLHYLPTLLSEGPAGFDSLRAKCRKHYTPMAKDVRELMQEWFQLRGTSPQELPAGTSQTLWASLKKALGGDVEPRSTDASLSGTHQPRELVAA